jgi:outer membrane protein
MNLKLITLCLPMLLCFSAGNLFAENCLIGTVDYEWVKAHSRIGVESEKALTEKEHAVMEKVNSKMLEVQKLQINYQRYGMSLPAVQRTARQKEIRERIFEFNELNKKAQTLIQQERNENNVTFGRKFNEAVREFGRAKGYTVILKKTEVIFSTDNQVLKDVSNDVLMLMDKQKRD